jgi:hypothetical protein
MKKPHPKDDLVKRYWTRSTKCTLARRDAPQIVFRIDIRADKSTMGITPRTDGP